MTGCKFIIVGFDALRRDLLSSDLMPNLAEFAAGGCDFSNSRATFPTETRVNSASLATGTHPTRHGIVANSFFDPALPGAHLFKTGALTPDTKVYGGKPVTATSLGEVLAEAGMQCATVSAGTPGNALMLNPRARALGQVTYSVQGPESCTPVSLFVEMAERFGPVPAGAVPNIGRCTYATDVLLGHILPNIAPDVATIWYSEPDISFHNSGIGSPDSITAMRALDHEFARILAWRECQVESEAIQIITISDHGQITARKRLDIVAALCSAGFRAGSALSPDVDFVCVASGSGNIFVRDGNMPLLRTMVDWLREQPWIGTLFTTGRNEVEGIIPGTFAHDLVGNAHNRTPYLLYTLKTDDAPNAFGAPGSCYYWMDGIPEGRGGVHGGLHPLELHNFMAAGGSIYRPSAACSNPSGIVDIAPTILHALGLDQPASMHGRVLFEALQSAEADTPATASETFITGHGSYSQSLSRACTVGVAYLNGAWRDA